MTGKSNYKPYYATAYLDLIWKHALTHGQVLARWMITESTFIGWLDKHQDLLDAYEEVKRRKQASKTFTQRRIEPRRRYCDDIHPALYKKLYQQGLTQADILKGMGIVDTTFRRWAIQCPEFKKVVTECPPVRYLNRRGRNGEE